MKKMKKKFSERLHAKRRFLERHQMSVTTNFLDQLVAKIQDGAATFLKRESNRITLFRVNHKGKDFEVVYDSRTKQIVTVFPGQIIS